MAKGAGTKEVQYSVVPSPKREPLTGAEQSEFESKPTIDEVIEKLKEKQSSEPAVQQEAPQQPQSGYEKAKAVAKSLLGGNPPAAGQTEADTEDVSAEDIPF